MDETLKDADARLGDRAEEQTYLRLSLADRKFLGELGELPPIGSLPVEEERARMRAGQVGADTGYAVEVELFKSSACVIHLFRPRGWSLPSPVVFFLHGGGWVLGDVTTHRRLVCELAVQTGCTVAFIDYPLAPEHPFPEAIESSVVAISEVLAHAGPLGLDVTRFAMGGDSAGGNLAAAIVLTLMERGFAEPALLFLLYPALQPFAETRSYLSFGGNPNLSRETMDWFWRSYLRDESWCNDPRADLLKVPEQELKRFPASLIVTCEYDVLLDEGEQFAARLVEAGVEVTAVRWLGALHGFLVNETLSGSRTARACLELVANYIRRGLSA